MQAALLGVILTLVPLVLKGWHPVVVGVTLIATITVVFYVVDIIGRRITR